MIYKTVSLCVCVICCMRQIACVDSACTTYCIEKFCMCNISYDFNINVALWYVAYATFFNTPRWTCNILHVAHATCNNCMCNIATIAYATMQQLHLQHKIEKRLKKS